MDTGLCLVHTCQDGWAGPSCLTAVPYDPSNTIAAVITPIIILLLIVAGIVAVFLYKRRKRARKKKRERKNDTPLRLYLGLADAHNSDTVAESSIYQNVHIQPADRSKVCCLLQDADGNTTATRSATTQQGAGPAVVGDLTEDNSLDQEDSFQEEFSHEDLYARYSTVPSRTQLDAFQRLLLDSLASLDGLSQQFRSFPKGMLFEWTAGGRPENLRKNRFKNLGAYDKNRVVLVRAAGDTNTDYINASYIKGAFHDREYIAMQGPLEQTKDDMWQMVWQQKVAQIVMLTNLEESGKKKCSKYWPDERQTMEAGNVKITSLKEDVRADFIIRSFSLKLKGSSGIRYLHQYHYVSWPDHGVPTAGSLLDYWLYVTSRASPDVPPLVHCSAGVGRTGTYIALDIAFNRKSRGLEVNVLDIVKELREQRTLMVQTEAQYKFLHEIILEAYSSQNTRLKHSHLQLHFSGDIDVWKSQNAMSREYQMLRLMKSWAKRNASIAEIPENMNKNRDLNNLPDDRHLVFLTEHDGERNQYINAVVKSSLTQKLGLLLTQLPFATTVVDLWRLVVSSKVHTIVCLGPLGQTTVDQGFVPYWPVKKGKSITTGSYTITLNRVTSLETCIITYTLSVKSKVMKPRTVQVLHYTDWSEDVPGNVADVCHLVKIARNATENDPAPLLIQCLDGSNKSGLFCVLYDVISRMVDDEDIDVFSAVRAVHQIRPSSITEAQYRYCYQGAKYFEQSQTVYGNV